MIRDFRKDTMKTNMKLQTHAEMRAADLKKQGEEISALQARIDALKVKVGPVIQRHSQASASTSASTMMIYGGSSTQRTSRHAMSNSSTQQPALPSAHAGLGMGTSRNGLPPVAPPAQHQLAPHAAAMMMGSTIPSAPVAGMMMGSSSGAAAASSRAGLQSHRLGASASTSSLLTSSASAPSSSILASTLAASSSAAAIAEEANWFHPGQCRKHRNMEYWTCCQTPSAGNKDARGCQPRQ